MTEPLLRPLNFQEDDDLVAFCRVRGAANQHGRPHAIPPTVEEVAAVWRAVDNGWTQGARGAFVDGELVAVVAVRCPEDDNLDTAWIFAHTLPSHRRRGLATRLVRDAIADLEPARTKVMSWVRVPSGTDGSHPYLQFVERFGGRIEGRETTYELALPAELPAVTLDDRYVIEVHQDGSPEERQAQLGMLMGLVEVEAPTGDVVWEGAAVSPERYRQEISAQVNAGGHVLEALAIDRSSGDVVGFTQIGISPDPLRPAEQEGTLVLREHRGRGVGQALKVANLAALQERWPHLTRVSTAMDDDNASMQWVNRALGFTPVDAQLYVRFPRT